jgi:hypothetical protein
MLERQIQELRDLPARVASVESQILQLREEMRDGFSSIRSELRAEIQSGNQETRNFMRALYEDALARIATMGEAKRSPEGGGGRTGTV